MNYGLQNEDGVVPKAAVEEIAKVVNWQPQGGVARTGGVVDEPSEAYSPNEPKNYTEVTVSDDGHKVSLDDVPF